MGQEDGTGGTVLDAALRRYLDAMHEVVKGNAGPTKAIYSHRDDVTMCGAGGTEHGFAAVKARWEWWAEHGPLVPNSAREYLAIYTAPELAQTVFIEHTPKYDMRITHTYRREGGAWRMVHRHADGLGVRQQP